MTTIARQKTWVTGDTLTAADLNAEFNNIVNDYNGSIDDTNIGTIARTLTITDATNEVALNLTSSATTANALALTASALTTGSNLYVYSNSADTGTRSLASIVNDNSASSGCTALKIQQDADQTGLQIDTAATSASGLVINGDTITTGTGITMTDFNALTSGKILSITSNSSDATSRQLVSIINDHTSATSATCLFLRQDANADAINISHTANENSIAISASGLTTSTALSIVGDAVTSGSLASFSSNSSDATARNLVSIVNDHTSATGAKCLNIQQDAAASGITLTHGGAAVAMQLTHTGASGTGFNMTKSCNSASDIYGMAITNTNAGAGRAGGISIAVSNTDPSFQLPADAVDPTSGGGAATGRILVRIGGADRYLAYY